MTKHGIKKKLTEWVIGGSEGRGRGHCRADEMLYLIYQA